MNVAYAIEHLRDGVEECAMIFARKEDAIGWINKIANGFACGNHSFKLFLLGKEIKLEADNVETPQPPVVQRRFKAGG